MSDQESATPREDEDVEAHKKSKVMATDEAPKDEESDDDVELQRKSKAM